MSDLALLIRKVMEELPVENQPSMTLVKEGKDYLLQGDGGRVVNIVLFPGNLQFVRQDVEAKDVHFYETQVGSSATMNYVHDPKKKTVTFKTFNQVGYATETLKAILTGEKDAEMSKREESGTTRIYSGSGSQ